MWSSSWASLGKMAFNSCYGMRSIKSFVLPRFRRIASAQSVKVYQQAVCDLKESDEWKADTSEKFQNHVSKTWLPVYRVSDAWKLNSSVN